MWYICIDLKCFYASVECILHGYDPFTTPVVVSDASRGPGAITLAVSPYMKTLGIPSRGRLFEIPKDIKYICITPRMKKYIEYSGYVYDCYLKYVSSSDIHVYSIDEAFIDVTPYLKLYNKTAKEIGEMILKDIKDTLGLTATCGVGTNLYLAKIAMDILAKHDKTNVAFLDEEIYKKRLWNHVPLTDFWQVGKGIAKRLNKLNLYTMKEVSEADPFILYKEFGINAHNLIEHSYGREECTIKDIKDYKPNGKSMSVGQTLDRDYSYEEMLIVLVEMVDQLTLDIVKKNYTISGIGLYVGYSNKLQIAGTGGSTNLEVYTSSFEILKPNFINLFKKFVNPNIPIRRIGLWCYNIDTKGRMTRTLFSNDEKMEKENKLYQTVNGLKQKYGKNSIYKAVNITKSSTGLKRNKLIGGHNGE